MWAQKYRHEGNGIPILYVVRADGQQLYGRSGAKSGDELPQFLSAQLQTAGTIFSNQQLAALRAAVADARRAFDEGDAFTAVKRIDSIRKLGEPGRLGSYATVAIEADAVHQQLLEQGRQALQQAREQLASNDQRFAGVLGIVTANRTYQKLTELRKELGTAERELGKNAALKEELKQAELLDRALALLRQKNGQKPAVAALENIVTRFATSPAATIAQQKLSELGAAVPELETQKEPTTKFRVWKDRTGKFSIEAELIDVQDGQVELRRKDGEVIRLAIDRLSAEDQALLAKQP